MDFHVTKTMIFLKTAIRGKKSNKLDKSNKGIKTTKNAVSLLRYCIDFYAFYVFYFFYG